MTRSACAGFACLALLLLACGDAGTPAPPEPPAQPAEPATEAPSPAPEPAAAEVPAGNLRGDAAHGAELYGQYCWTCHGRGGKGDGPSSAALVPKPADHTDARFMATLSDAELYTVIEKGGAAVGKSPLMAGWGQVLSDQDVRDLIAHLRGLSGT